MPKLWSHHLAQGLAGAPSSEGALARELLSGRFGPSALIVLPLRSGGFAIFDYTRQLQQICTDSELPEALRQLSAAAATAAATPRACESLKGLL